MDAIDAEPELGRPSTPSRRRLTTAVTAEQRHRVERRLSRGLGRRRQQGYVYRKGALKKFMSSVLFLEAASAAPRVEASPNSSPGIAAGVAMLFSTVAAIWSQSAYGVNSFPFVVAMVIAYVFKDRIKEWLRTYFSAKLTRRLYDHDVDDPRPAQRHRGRRALPRVVRLLVRRPGPQEVYESRHGDCHSACSSPRPSPRW